MRETPRGSRPVRNSTMSQEYIDRIRRLPSLQKEGSTSQRIPQYCRENETHTTIVYEMTKFVQA